MLIYFDSNSNKVSVYPKLFQKRGRGWDYNDVFLQTLLLPAVARSAYIKLMKRKKVG